MPKSPYQKQLEANQHNDALYAQYAAQGKLISTTPGRSAKPNPTVQAADVRNRLADRYQKVANGQAVTIGSTRAPMVADKKGGLQSATASVARQAQGSAPGSRSLINAIPARPNSSYSNEASTVRQPSSVSPNTVNQDAARRMFPGSPAKTPTNSSTIFQEGLRARLAKR